MSRKTLLPWCLLVLTVFSASAQDPMQALKVSDNGRNLVTADGAPFFWLGDTAWRILRLKQPEIIQYLDGRLADGYNVIQGPVLIDFDGGKLVSDGAGDLPLTDPKDLSSLNEKYFAAADAFVAEAQKRFMYVVLAPMATEGVPNYSPDQLKVFGTALGARYKGRVNVLWMIFGTDPDRVNALGAGIDAGNGGVQLISVHPALENPSVWNEMAFHESNWLDFTSVRTLTPTNVQMGEVMKPAKPVLGVSGLAEEVQSQFGADGTAPVSEPGYAVRKQAYMEVFSGSMGTAYTSKSMATLGASQTGNDGAFDMKQNLATPGGDQLHYLKELIASRPMETHHYNDALFLQRANNISMAAMFDCTYGKKDAAATWIMAYVSKPTQVIVSTSVIPAKTLNIWRYDPRTGNALQLEKNFPNTGQINFAPQEDDRGPDWVVVIDDASKKYPAPGKPLSK